MHTERTTVGFGFLLAAALVSAAFAGPEFDEGPKDAGSTPSTATTVSASQNVSVTRLRGSTAATALVGAADQVDMYLVLTGSSVSTFKIDMDMGTGGSPVWDARLTLFKRFVVNCGSIAPVWVTLAKPIATVHKLSGALPYPVLDANAPLVGGGTLGSLLTPNTQYFVAVSGSTELPLGVREDCGGTTEFSLFGSVIGVPGIHPVPVEQQSFHLTKWSDTAGSATGPYAAVTTGVYPMPAYSCATAVTVVGSPATKAFDFSFSPLATNTVVPCAPGYVVKKEFFFEWTAPCTGSAEISTCGLTTADTGLEVFEVNSCTGSACEAAAGASIACNDQCGTANASLVTFATQSGNTYLIRLTGFTSLTGTGSLRFVCSGTVPTPSGDVNGDGLVDGADLAIVLGQWGTSGN